MIPFHGEKRKTQQPTKHKNRTPQLGMVYPKAAMRRNDKAACVPSPERVILETQTQKKASRQQCRSGISTLPTPCCESLRQQHLNNSKQHGALAKMGNMQAGPETFNQQLCSPGSCHSVRLAKELRFVKAAPVLAKRSLQQSRFRGHKQISSLDSQRGALSSMLLRDTSHLTVDNPSVGLFSTKGSCNFEA